MIEAKIIADSISPKGKRITTMEVNLPKVLLAEFNTHRVLSRNFSSSRAIPTTRFNNIQSFTPLYWGLNQAGMEAKMEELSEADKEYARQIWNETIEYCKAQSEKLSRIGLHKQWANRLNDWHVMARGIVTATEWDNFFMLRQHHSAQPEIQTLANSMYDAMQNSIPEMLTLGEWHAPYVTYEEKLHFAGRGEFKNILKCSAARCARVSYFKTDGTKPSVEDDIALFERLVVSHPPHMSPVEHQASPLDEETHLSGNFKNWIQWRKMLEKELSGETNKHYL